MVRILELIMLADVGIWFLLGIYDKRVSEIYVYIAIGLYILLKIIQQKRKFWKNFPEKTFLNRPIFVFLGISALTVILSQDILHSQEIFFQRYLLYFLMFYVGVFIAKNKKSFLFLVGALIASNFIISIGGVYDLLRATRFTDLLTSYGIRAFFSIYFLCVAPFFIGLALFHLRLKVRIIAACASLPVLACFWFHYSRGAIIAFIVSLIAMTLFFTRYKRLVIVIVLVFILFATFMPQTGDKLFSMITLQPDKWGDRVPMWTSAVKIFMTRPVFGAGLGMYEKLIYKFLPVEKFGEGNIHLHAHSTYFEMLAEMGLAGILSFFYLFFVFFKTAFSRIKKRFDVYLFSFTLMAMSVLIGEIISSALLVGRYFPFLFWFLLGMGTTVISKTGS